MNTEMRDVVGFEGLYKVTPQGDIWGCKQQKFLKPAGGKDYQMVCLHKDGKPYYDYVHRIVAKAYIPNPNNYPEVNHKDEVKYHNWADNLEWCDKKYNLEYSMPRKAKKVYCVELDKTFRSLTEAARATNISICNLSALLKKKDSDRHTLGGYHWKRCS